MSLVIGDWEGLIPDECFNCLVNLLVIFLQHDDRDGEKTWVDNRGRGRGSFPTRRGRFVYRKGGGSSPKWTHDMFQGGDDGGLGDENIDIDRKEAKNTDDGSSLK